MQFIGMVAAAEFQAAGLGVRLVVGHSFCHAVAFVQLVQQHKAPFLLLDGVVDPDLALRDEFINVVMAAGREVNVERASHQPTIHNPYPDAILKFLA